MKTKPTPVAPKGRNDSRLAIHDSPQTLEDVERLMGELALKDARRRALTAKMDEQLKAIRDRYAADLDALDAAAKALEDEIASWAELHKPDFGERRSLVLAHGTIGWRLGNPAVRLRPRVKAEQALAMVKERLPQYVRTTEELDKAALLAAFSGKALTAEDLAACGLRVAQTERFYCEPKTEAAP